MSLFVAFDHEGTLVGATGDTIANVLDQLEGMLGDEVADAVGDSITAVAERLQAAGRESAGGHPAGDPVSDIPRPRRSPAALDVPIVYPPEELGATRTSTAPAQAAEKEACGVCGAGVPPDFAGVAKELYGEARCVKCAAL